MDVTGKGKEGRKCDTAYMKQPREPILKPELLFLPHS